MRVHDSSFSVSVQHFNTTAPQEAELEGCDTLEKVEVFLKNFSVATW